MISLYIGYSTQRTRDEVVEFLDYDPTHPDGISLFRRTIGYEAVPQGGYEAYPCHIPAPDPYDNNVENKDDFVKFVGYDLAGIPALDEIDWQAAKCVFFIAETRLKSLTYEDIRFFGPYEVEGLGGDMSWLKR